MTRTRFLLQPQWSGRLYTLNHRRNNSGRICWFWNSWNLAAPPPIRLRRCRRSLGTTSDSWRWWGPRPMWRPSWSPEQKTKWWQCQYFISLWILIWTNVWECRRVTLSDISTSLACLAITATSFGSSLPVKAPITAPITGCIGLTCKIWNVSPVYYYDILACSKILHTGILFRILYALEPIWPDFFLQIPSATRAV